MFPGTAFTSMNTTGMLCKKTHMSCESIETSSGRQIKHAVQRLNFYATGHVLWKLVLQHLFQLWLEVYAFSTPLCHPVHNDNCSPHTGQATNGETSLGAGETAHSCRTARKFYLASV